MSDTSPIVLLNLGSDILNSADQFSTVNYYSGKLQVLAFMWPCPHVTITKTIQTELEKHHKHPKATQPSNIWRIAN